MITTSTRPDYTFLGKANSLHFKIKWFKVHSFFLYRTWGWRITLLVWESLSALYPYRPGWLCSSCFQHMWGTRCVWQMDLQECHGWQLFAHVLAKKKWSARIPAAAENLTDHCARNFPAMLMKFLGFNSPGKIAWCLPATLQKVRKWEGHPSWDSCGVMKECSDSEILFA